MVNLVLICDTDDPQIKSPHSLPEHQSRATKCLSPTLITRQAVTWTRMAKGCALVWSRVSYGH